MEIIERWCNPNDFSLKNQNSAILHDRADHRIPVNVNNIRGIPIIENYKYLGVNFDDEQSFRSEMHQLNKLINAKLENSTNFNITSHIKITLYGKMKCKYSSCIDY